MSCGVTEYVCICFRVPAPKKGLSYDSLQNYARHEAKEELKKVEHVSDDDKRHTDRDLQKLTDDHIKMVDEMVKHKEAEIMEV